MDEVREGLGRDEGGRWVKGGGDQVVLKEEPSFFLTGKDMSNHCLILNTDSFLQKIRPS